MAITKISNSGILPGTKKYDSMLAGNAAYDPAATWFIQRVNGTGSSSTITLSSIPQTYQHLQLRIMAKNTNTTALSGDNVLIRFNSDTGSNYVTHRLYGDGASAGALANTGGTSIILESASAFSHSSIANTCGTAIVDIHDYASTTKNKVIRSLSGVNGNTTTVDFTLALTSGLWLNTNAITSISVISQTSSFTTSTTVALYGFIGA